MTVDERIQLDLLHDLSPRARSFLVQRPMVVLKSRGDQLDATKESASFRRQWIISEFPVTRSRVGRTGKGNAGYRTRVIT